MSSDRKRRNWSEYVQPHVCNHASEEPFLIEWCVCPIGQDHPWDDLRIEPHEASRPSGEGEPGWHNNPVTQTLSKIPAVLAAVVAANPDAVSDSDKLRTIADWIDVADKRVGNTGTEAQEFLRGLAERLEGS
jgi:hypothetical protein